MSIEHTISIIVPRLEGFNISTVAHVKATTSFPMTTKELLTAVQSAVRGWIENTEEGHEEWHRSANDLNVGDLAGYHRSKQLEPWLHKNCIYKLEIEIHRAEDNKEWMFDTILGE
jgi:hypothetical protein